MDKIKVSELYGFCKGRYYTDDKELWQPFEAYSKVEINQLIVGDVLAMVNFLNNRNVNTVNDRK